jgi:phospholipid:diacylglycerol acyltransferase
LQALSIDPETGLDPPGFKVRAAQGLDAAVSGTPSRIFGGILMMVQSEFIQGEFSVGESVERVTKSGTGYWVWQKIVQNLAMLDYDTNSLDMAAYDW